MKNAKRILAHLLAVVMMLSCLSALFVGGTITASAEASVYTAAGSLPSENNGVYVINSANEFMAFANALNGGNNFAGKTIKLNCDVVLNQGSYDSWKNNSNKVAWSGNGSGWGTRFAGSFDGQGHYISGIYNENGNAAGLFGRIVGNTTFQNVTIKESYFESRAGADGDGLGALIGMIDPSWAAGTTTIKNVHVESTILNATQGSASGGIVGQAKNFGNSGLVIENCSFQGTINAGSSSGVGGIVGNVTSGTDLVLQNCSAKATITCANEAAGLVGKVSICNVVISNCLAKASITSQKTCINNTNSSWDTGKYRTGGIIGYVRSDSENVTVQIGNVLIAVSCNSAEAAIATVFGSSADYTVTFILEKMLYDQTIQSWSGLIRRDNSNSVKAKVNNYSAQSGGNWNLESQYASAGEDVNFQIWGKATSDLKGFKAFNFWTAVPNDYPKPPTTSVTDFYNGTPSYRYVKDTSAKTVTIYTAEQLMGFASDTSGNNFSGYTVKLANDMVINEGLASDWASTAPSYNWACSTGWGNRFVGTFDGQGHTISGVYSKQNDYVGLFKYAGEGSVIQNLNVVNSYFESSHEARNAGGLIGAMVCPGGSTGVYTITNVYVDAIVKGTKYAGGLIGSDEWENLNNRKTTTNITNCGFNGTVSCSNGYAGGIIGWMRSTKNFYGCTVKGTISASGSYVGGMVGLLESIGEENIIMQNCNVKVELNGTEQIGGLFGRITGAQSITISNCLVKSEINPTKTSNTTTAGLIGAHNTSSYAGTVSVTNTLISVRGEYVAAVVASRWGSSALTMTLSNVKYDYNQFNGVRDRDVYVADSGTFTRNYNVDSTVAYERKAFADLKGVAVFSSGWTAVPGDYPVPTSAKSLDTSKTNTFKNFNDNQPTELLGYQVKKNSNGTLSIRLIATFKNRLYTNFVAAGFENIVITLTDGTTRTKDKWYCRYAYKTLNAGGATYTASEYLSEAFFCLSFDNVPSTAEIYSIAATPFVRVSSSASADAQVNGTRVTNYMGQALTSGSSSTPMLTVMSLNMYLKSDADPDGSSGPKTAADRRNGVLAQVYAQQPDVFCVQEDAWAKDYLDSTLKNYGYTAYRNKAISRAGYSSGSYQYYSYQAIYYKTALFTVKGSGQKWLSDTPNTQYSRYDGNDDCRPRGINYVKLQYKTTGEMFFVFNVHLENADSGKRLNEVNKLISLVSQIAGSSTPYLLCGDFNLITHYDVDSNDVTAKANLKTAYDDSRLIADYTETFGTFLDAEDAIFGTTGTATSKSGNIIDYCFTKKNAFHIYSFDVISEKQNGIYTSDHLPIVIKMSFN